MLRKKTRGHSFNACDERRPRFPLKYMTQKVRLNWHRLR